MKNVVTRALGGESDVLVDVREMEVQPGDLFLLCSDGLTGMLSDADIRDRLDSGRSLHEICRTLITDSNARGGIDNVTVVLLAIEERTRRPRRTRSARRRGRGPATRDVRDNNKDKTGTPEKSLPVS